MNLTSRSADHSSQSTYSGEGLADDKIITFDDPIRKVPPGYVLYPEALINLREVLTELIGPQMGRPKEFNAKIELYLDLIIGRFDSVHRTHAKANAVYERYRTAGQP